MASCFQGVVATLRQSSSARASAAAAASAAGCFVGGRGKSMVGRRSSGVRDGQERVRVQVFRALLCVLPPIPWMHRLRLAARLGMVPLVRVRRERLWITKITFPLVRRSQGRMGGRTTGIRANSVRSKGSAVVDAMRHNRLRQFVPERTPRQGCRDRHRALEGAAGDCKLLSLIHI